MPTPLKAISLTILATLHVMPRGDVKYGDQLPGKWMLFSSGIALLVLNDERSVNLFYDHNQWHDPNGGTYDIK